jgi:hypothetical protein
VLVFVDTLKLIDYFISNESQLSEEQVRLLGKKCRINTIRRLRSILTYSPSMIKSYGILNRLILEDNHWRYIADQDYVSEIKTVRQLILD